MRIGKDKVVTIDYTLTDNRGAVIDSSKGSDPFAYIQGTGNIIPGLEQALEGKAAGEQVNVTVSPDQGYGIRDDSLVQTVTRDQFEGVDEVQVGMRFHAQTDQGQRVVTVVSVAEDSVTVDGNHPLAGETLNFDVTIVNVRDATQEEIEHGHVHGPEGHNH